MAKLIQPETEVSKFIDKNISLSESQHINVIAALVSGALDAVRLCVNIVVMVAAFLIMVDLFDTVFGHASGHSDYNKY